jgi:phenylacetate-coenzyme A ligase PaaK-like adenylate-forming protein
MKGQWNDKIFNVSPRDFDPLVLELFRFQYANNPVYRAFTDSLHIAPGTVKSIDRIPFLPIRFFKSHSICSTSFEPEIVFESSGTTGSIASRHLVKDTALYRQSFSRAFELVYGPPAEWCILGLLPSYLERKNSSLVFMVNELISQSRHVASGFYLDDFEKLKHTLAELEKQGQKTLLIGVTFALLDFAEKYQADSKATPLQHTIIMETGGMKGRRVEQSRPAVHALLKKAFGVSLVHSEYGMTELLSQAYSGGEGIFQYPPWMKILVRSEDDPLEVTEGTEPGAINIIDLANVYSCCFIATDDAGRLLPGGSFEVLGRMENSDLRGCSLLTL